MITSWHDLRNACYGGELCMLAAIIQHLVADSGGHTGGGRASWIYYTINITQPSYFNTFLISNREWVAMCLEGGEMEWDLSDVTGLWSLSLRHLCLVRRDGDTGRQQGSSCSHLSEWCECLGNMQRDLDPWLIRVKEASEAVIRSVDPVSEHPSMTWHHFIITVRPSNTLLLTERDVTITLLAAIRPCAQFMRWI